MSIIDWAEHKRQRERVRKARGGGSMKMAIAADAWAPQVNGVVRTLEMTIKLLKARGHEVKVGGPGRLRRPMPGLSGNRLALAPRFGMRKILAEFQPDIVHISTEGPIGWSARPWCMKNDVPFTTAFHTRFPEYASVRTGLSSDLIWPVMRRFHAPSRAVLSATPRLSGELAGRGITHTRPWTRGIDTAIFRPGLTPHPALANLPRPNLSCRWARSRSEKYLESFLGAAVAGTKVVVGDGPALEQLIQRFPDAVLPAACVGPSWRRLMLLLTSLYFRARPTLSDW